MSSPERAPLITPAISRWPKVRQSYLGFRYGGRMQAIRHVDDSVIETYISRHLPGVPTTDWELHFIVRLGPPMRPDHPVPKGPSVLRSSRVWADLDLLLTADSITDPWRISRERRAG